MSSVSFARSGPTVPWHPDYGTLLELAEACGVPVRWSCRTGVCHTCETALFSGHVDYSPVGSQVRDVLQQGQLPVARKRWIVAAYGAMSRPCSASQVSE
ncbi:2Fe-2S iron-sulfur cluster-binding protein [Streptomyces atratus]|uniref:2Fe-2S iron-sulfur cluster-binding protein n=1 Tax=Streptomyces atratus TaxID=1893 RepID=UPI0033C6120D